MTCLIEVDSGWGFSTIGSVEKCYVQCGKSETEAGTFPWWREVSITFMPFYGSKIETLIAPHPIKVRCHGDLQEEFEGIFIEASHPSDGGCIEIFFIAHSIKVL
jgi:hypothetical protein